MTTKKQAAANRANAQKSTGPKTAEGKTAVSLNAISHGILCQRLFLEGEDPADFAALQDGLRAALRPIGVLELALVEKIALAMWRQRRLVGAETAAIELGRRLSRHEQEIRQAVGNFSVEWEQCQPLDADEQEQLEWCNGVVAEFEAIDDAALAAGDEARLEVEAPRMFGQWRREVEDAERPASMYTWADELVQWCEREIRKLENRPALIETGRLVAQKYAAPMNNDLLIRYQAALDGDLYRAMRALREQQEWRLKSGMEIEAEAAC